MNSNIALRWKLKRMASANGSRCILLLALIALSGCVIVPNGSKWIPKPVWYWSADAKEQRRLDAERKAASDQPSKDWQGDLQKAIDAQKHD